MEKNCGNCRFSKDICSKEGMCWFRPGPGYPDWQPIEEEKTMEKIQEPFLTEEQRDILWQAFINTVAVGKEYNIWKQNVFKEWEKYIKKDFIEEELDEARKYLKNEKNKFSSIEFGLRLETLSQLYESVISLYQEKLNASGKK